MPRRKVMRSVCVPGVNSASVTVTILVFVCMISAGALAQAPGVSANEIRIGSCSALDGPARQLGIETIMGATAYFDYINEQGGVDGRKLRLISHDDGYDPENA